MTGPAGESIDRLVAQVAELISRPGLTLAVAETCTGGLLSAALTETAGSSSFFFGSVVPYHDWAKIELLGVNKKLIESHGAVSAEVAGALATAVRAQFQSTIGVAITGIAGPGGDRPGKPVGLTFISIAAEREPQTKRFVWSGDRFQNRRSSVRAALEMLHEFMTPTVPSNR